MAISTAQCRCLQFKQLMFESFFVRLSLLALLYKLNWIFPVLRHDFIDTIYSQFPIIAAKYCLITHESLSRHSEGYWSTLVFRELNYNIQ